jgi:hypothetical protein
VRLSADELDRLTPPSRDRYVDFLRALSIVVVVVGHWTIALIFWEDARIFVHNVVGPVGARGGGRAGGGEVRRVSQQRHGRALRDRPHHWSWAVR